jgi:hypothetical protein
MLRIATLALGLLSLPAAIAAPIGLDVTLTAYQEYGSCPGDMSQFCINDPVPVDLRFQYVIDVEFNPSALVVDSFSTPFATIDRAYHLTKDSMSPIQTTFDHPAVVPALALPNPISRVDFDAQQFNQNIYYELTTQALSRTTITSLTSGRTTYSQGWNAGFNQVWFLWTSPDAYLSCFNRLNFGFADPAAFDPQLLNQPWTEAAMLQLLAGANLFDVSFDTGWGYGPGVGETVTRTYTGTATLIARTVPEPESLAVFVVGIAGLAWAMRRRN